MSHGNNQGDHLPKLQTFGVALTMLSRPTVNLKFTIFEGNTIQ